MKKALTTLITLMLTLAVMCTSALALSFEDVVPYGALKALDFELEALDQNTDDSWTENNDEYMIEYDSFVSMQMALNSGRIKLMYCPEIVANYAKTMNPDYYVRSYVSGNAFLMGVLPEREDLRNSLNEAITELKAEGTLDALAEQYLEGNLEFDRAEPVEGRETLRVVITGDYAPIDYISPDGTPNGYNVALMQAIGDKLGYNIEYVCVDFTQRLLALTTDKADVIFLIQLQAQTNEENAFVSPDGNQSILVTKPYLTCGDATVALNQDILDFVSEYFAAME